MRVEYDAVVRSSAAFFPHQRIYRRSRGIALVVFMNHYACDQLPKSEGKEADFLELQLHGTKNVDPGIFMDWFAELTEVARTYPFDSPVTKTRIFSPNPGSTC